MVLAALACLVSCVKENPMDREKDALDNRVDNTRRLEVSYSLDGTETKAVVFDNRAQDIVINVEVNDPNLVWNLESNRTWCTIVDEKHKGSGPVTLRVGANESFDSRVQATLTFVAGEYRGFKITVDQEGSVFILGQPFILSARKGSTSVVNATVAKDGGQEPDWSVEADSWITVVKGAAQDNGESVTRALTITCSDNSAPSRFGKLTLSRKGAVSKSYIYVSQFGSDYSYDESGNIKFGKTDKAHIEFLAPAKTIASVECPPYATSAIEEVDAETVKVIIEADENFSDCSELRSTESFVILSNETSTRLDVPVFVQDYVPAHGLVTPKGLCRFAAAVNSGADISDWQKDGVVVLLNDIDMAGVDSWVAAGTAAHPFKGEFNGGKHTIDNLKKTSEGLFGVCDNATVRDLNLGSGCNIYRENTFASDIAFGALASELKSSTLKSCSFAGSIEFAGRNTDDCNAYVGGIVGKADASSYVLTCKLDGKLVVSSPTASELSMHIGGVVGKSLGTTESCECAGSLELSTGAVNLYAGGIQGRLAGSAKALSNSFLGSIVVNGACKYNAVGGVYGLVEGKHTFDSASDKSIAMGSISVNKFGGAASDNLFAGGFIGQAAKSSDISIAGYESMCRFVVDHSNVLTANYLGIGGLVGGSDPEGVSSIALTNLTNRGTMVMNCNSSVATAVAVECIAGIMGYHNGKASISGCANEGALGDATTNAATAKSNAKTQVIAGILAFAEGGNVTVTKCTNSANIVSPHYNNNAYDHLTAGRYDCNVQSGIIGVFGYYQTHSSNTITISECTSAAYVQGYRGVTAGIVGYAENAQISKCTVRANMSGSTMQGVSKMGNNAAYKGGVAGGLYNSIVTGCEVKTDIYSTSPGSEIASPAGILSRDFGRCAISDCSYFGTVTVATLSTGAVGGLVAFGANDLTVSNCKFGGSLNGTKINENNVAANAIGNSAGTATSITYWDGN